MGSRATEPAIRIPESRTDAATGCHSDDAVLPTMPTTVTPVPVRTTQVRRRNRPAEPAPMTATTKESGATMNGSTASCAVVAPSTCSA